MVSLLLHKTVGNNSYYRCYYLVLLAHYYFSLGRPKQSQNSHVKSKGIANSRRLTLPRCQIFDPCDRKLNSKDHSPRRPGVRWDGLLDGTTSSKNTSSSCVVRMMDRFSHSNHITHICLYPKTPRHWCRGSKLYRHATLCEPTCLCCSPSLITCSASPLSLIPNRLHSLIHNLLIIHYYSIPFPPLSFQSPFPTFWQESKKKKHYEVPIAHDRYGHYDSGTDGHGSLGSTRY
jgi:hypothetical protein